MERIEVMYKPGIDSRGDVIKAKIEALMKSGAITPGNIEFIRIVDAYSINKDIDPLKLDEIARMLHKPVTQDVKTDSSFIPDDVDYAIEIGFNPGVTDNVATTVRKGIESKLGSRFLPDESVHSTQVLLIGGDLSIESVDDITKAMANPLIQSAEPRMNPDLSLDGFRPYIPRIDLDPDVKHMVVPIREMSFDELKLTAKEGILDPRTGTRRGPLSLDTDNATPIKIIRDHYIELGRDPTDAELECLAQTWSEHCKHTIFAAALDKGTANAVPKGLYDTYIKGSTQKIRQRWKELGREDFLLSVFTDNSGILKFDDKHAITVKVETHNSPSALDPYGGSITGIVGVDRDAIGAGLGAMPYNHRFFFCFDDPKSQRVLFKKKRKDGTLEERMLSTRSIMDGVIEGVKDGGNKSGIPTPQGGAFFHKSYTGKPLVFVGVDGIMPLESAGRNSWEKKANSGDIIVMIGGRVGLDGIHGATFSSESMDEGSPIGAVQIGDPITQKKLSDAICKEARDLGLYNSITDNGAGGLSCSVYEMAKECGGATMYLERVPLKYPGMRPDQILISESQERMTLAVPKDKLDQFMAIMEKHDVEATAIGEFNDSGQCVAEWKGEKVLDLDMDFFHDGLPQRELTTTFTPELYEHEEPELEEQEDLTEDFLSMLGRQNIASKEFIFEQFDHEVQGGSVVKPMVGPGKADSNATVTRPVLDSMKAVASTQAMFPRYSQIDTYDMAAAAIDTAVRNMIAVGGKLNRMVLLDNFCWCSSDDPERLGQLKRAAEGAHDITTEYLTPLVSGKDSMFNTFKGFDEKGEPQHIDVLPTLMISGASIMPDAEKSMTLDAKVAGDLIYIIGTTDDELGGSEYLAMKGEQKTGEEYIGNNVPKVHAETNRETYSAMEDAIEDGLVASCTSVEMGGLAMALAKSAIGGQFGMDIDIKSMIADRTITGNVDRMDSLIFSESMGRFVVTVDPKRQQEFEDLFEGMAYSCIGTVTEDNEFTVRHGEDHVFIQTYLEEMNTPYKSTFEGH